MPKFITLCGKKQVGKDTSALIMQALLSNGTISFNDTGVEHFVTWNIELDAATHVVHFADALKKACSLIFGISLKVMETEEGKQKFTNILWPHSTLEPGTSWVPHRFIGHHDGYDKQYMTVREILQFVGTDLFRTQLDPDIWVKSVFNQPYQDDDVVIIADARFPNEADYSRERGLLIKIERDTGLPSDDHVSEKALDDYPNDRYNYVVENNGSFDDLRDKLGVILVAEGFIDAY